MARREFNLRPAVEARRRERLSCSYGMPGKWRLNAYATAKDPPSALIVTAPEDRLKHEYEAHDCRAECDKCERCKECRGGCEIVCPATDC